MAIFLKLCGKQDKEKMSDRSGSAESQGKLSQCPREFLQHGHHCITALPPKHLQQYLSVVASSPLLSQ